MRAVPLRGICGNSVGSAAAGGRAAPTDMVDSSTTVHTKCGGQPTGYMWPITTHPSREIVEPIMLRNIFTQQHGTTVERSVSESGRGGEPGRERLKKTRRARRYPNTNTYGKACINTHTRITAHPSTTHTVYANRKAKQTQN